jgi:hypothetical protein
MTHFVILTRDHNGNWADDCVGDGNRFDTEEEAWAAVQSLRDLGGEWAGVEYRVVEREA